MHVPTGKVAGLARPHVVTQNENIVPKLRAIAAAIETVKPQNVTHHSIRITQNHMSRHRLVSPLGHPIKELRHALRTIVQLFLNEVTIAIVRVGVFQLPFEESIPLTESFSLRLRFTQLTLELPLLQP